MVCLRTYSVIKYLTCWQLRNFFRSHPMVVGHLLLPSVSLLTWVDGLKHLGGDLFNSCWGLGHHMKITLAPCYLILIYPPWSYRSHLLCFMDVPSVTAARTKRCRSNTTLQGRRQQGSLRTNQLAAHQALVAEVSWFQNSPSPTANAAIRASHHFLWCKG